MEDLVLRLEAALGRLEAAAPLPSSEQRLHAAVSRLESLLSSSSALAPAAASARSTPAPPAPALSGVGASSPSAAAASTPSSVAFSEMVAEYLPRVKQAAASIGDSLELSVEQLEKALTAEAGIVLAISQCKMPDASGVQKLVAPLVEAMEKANKLTEGKRKSTFHHAKAVAESLASLSWVCYTEKGCGLSLPGPHIDESWPQAEFYTNRILMEHKNKEGGGVHVEFAKALKELYTKGLKDYVKKFHLQGPAWAASGKDLNDYLASGPAKARGPPPPPPSGAPPPPPPGAGPPPLPKGPGAAAPGADMAKVFSQLNQGEAVTAGLKKVTADMKTKNRADRSGFVSVEPKATSAAPAAKSAASTAKTGGTPKFELEQDRKWVVEFQVGKKDLVISDTKPQQTVYIFNCRDSVIQVKGKVNSISMDKCAKTALVFQDLVGSCEVVNCTSVEVQCQGSVPNIAIDNTSGCQLYLNAEVVEKLAIVTAKSTEVNVLVPGATAEDLVEHPLPEQFMNTYKGGKFITEPVSHTG